MSTPDRQHEDPHADRPRSGVRGVIDDILGRNDERPGPDGTRETGAHGADPRGPQDPGNHGPGSPSHVTQGPVGDPQRPMDGPADGRTMPVPAGSGGAPGPGMPGQGGQQPGGLRPGAAPGEQFDASGQAPPGHPGPGPAGPGAPGQGAPGQGAPGHAAPGPVDPSATAGGHLDAGQAAPAHARPTTPMDAHPQDPAAPSRGAAGEPGGRAGGSAGLGAGAASVAGVAAVGAGAAGTDREDDHDRGDHDRGDHDRAREHARTGAAGAPAHGRAATDPAHGDHAAGGPTSTDRDRTGDDGRLGSEAQGTAAHQAGSGMGEDAGGRERLVPAARAQEYGARWDAVKGAFVDEPRQAVRQADVLVGELLDELERLFREQRNGLEQGLDADATSTEDLRLALRRYRSFFDRLLSL